MDTRAELQKNDLLHFPGMECVIEKTAGRGSNMIAYIGRYADRLNPKLSHSVLIRELFPYDPKGEIRRDRDGSIIIGESARFLYELNRESFIRGNDVHLQLLQNLIRLGSEGRCGIPKP